MSIRDRDPWPSMDGQLSDDPEEALPQIDLEVRFIWERLGDHADMLAEDGERLSEIEHRLNACIVRIDSLARRIANLEGIHS